MCVSAVVSILALVGATDVACAQKFPPGFIFGAATAAYQVEGAWNVSDKGENIWDHITHSRPDYIADGTNGDVACDSYHLWEEDIKIIHDMGLGFYRFSINWPRLLPNGFSNKISKDGRRYYNQLIDGLLAKGIEPVVTIYHWEMPQILQDLGGWANPLIVDWFADYARVVFSLFGDRVKTWLTINEPVAVCDFGYRGVLAPAINDYEIGALLCSKHVVLAHAKAYRIYEKEFKAKYGGRISFASQEFWLEPETEQNVDIILTLLARDLAIRYTHPIYSKEGDWPPGLKKFMAEKSEKAGFARSRLPAFTDEELRMAKGSFDYFALNHYSSRTIRAANPGEHIGGFIFQGIEEIGAIAGIRPTWGVTQSSWLVVNPEGLRNNLKLIKQQYGDVEIIITENGFSDIGDDLNDMGRVKYYQEYLKQVLLAINEDGVNVIGYTAWSLMDNFEWTDGYQSRFGLHYVNFSDPLRPRTPKASARYYASVVRAHSLDVPDDYLHYILALVGVADVAYCQEFPPGFRFGAATAAYQIEGAWNVSDKGENIWDHITHTWPEYIADGTNGDVACDSYHLWEEDIKIIHDLGLDFYRFSINWPRLLPNGFSNKISEDGRRYYNQLIDGLLAKGIEPVVTIYHWEMPQSLQDLGGWANPLIVDWFADYARVVFSLFGDRVNTWLTINEPVAVCDLGYRGRLAPALDDYEMGALLCSKHLVLAHAKAYRIYEEEFKAEYGGKISFASQEFWLEPETESNVDIILTLLSRDLAFHRYTHPIYSETGGWPPALEKFLAEKSKQQGFTRSRLPAFTDEEIRMAKGSFDYFALNHYSSRTIRAANPGEQIGEFVFEGIDEFGAVAGIRPTWGVTQSSWLVSNPEGIRNNLKLIKQQYGDVEIIITENGFSDIGDDLNDMGRVKYYQEYLEQILLAINEDGVNVVGYTAWSLMDNFEWTDGYQSRFGLHYVNFSDPLRPRTQKASARYYASVVRSRSLDVPDDYLLYILALTSAVEVASQSFPSGFKFGAATAAYQVEGAWNVSDKGESIWDHITHTRPEFISDLSNGDVACDSYHLWEEDLKLIENLGVDFYRFSIAWPRLLPSGFSDKISEDGSRYYSDLIDGLRARGVEPVVTLYHWDLPQKLQDLGGWTNPLIVDWFADYSRVVFSLYADRVNTWLTINEPTAVCDGSYRDLLAPGLNDPDNGVLLCTKNLLLAHARVYRIYEEEFKPQYGGEVSIANHEAWLEPKTEDDLDITELTRDYAFGRYSHPIYSAEGGWPPVLEKFMAEKSEKEGYARSRLPAFTPEEIELIKGSYDFLALNHYTSLVVRAAEPGEEFGMYLVQGIEEVGAIAEGRPEWEAASYWLKVNPEGLRNNLKLIKQQYGDVKIIITENGSSDFSEDLNDVQRVEYYKDYLGQVLLAITEDGVNVAGYTAWSLIDNFEWKSGYEMHFGLHYVNFSDPLRPRTPKASARYYASVVRSRSLDVDVDLYADGI